MAWILTATLALARSAVGGVRSSTQDSGRCTGTGGYDGNLVGGFASSASIHAAAPCARIASTTAGVGPKVACSASRTASASTSADASAAHITTPSRTFPAPERTASVRSGSQRWFALPTVAEDR